MIRPRLVPSMYETLVEPYFPARLTSLPPGSQIKHAGFALHSSRLVCPRLGLLGCLALFRWCGAPTVVLGGPFCHESFHSLDSVFVRDSESGEPTALIDDLIEVECEHELVSSELPLRLIPPALEVRLSSAFGDLEVQGVGQHPALATFMLENRIGMRLSECRLVDHFLFRYSYEPMEKPDSRVRLIERSLPEFKQLADPDTETDVFLLLGIRMRDFADERICRIVLGLEHEHPLGVLHDVREKSLCEGVKAALWRGVLLLQLLLVDSSDPVGLRDLMNDWRSVVCGGV